MEQIKYGSYYKDYVKLNILKFFIKCLIFIGTIAVSYLIINALNLAYTTIMVRELPNLCEHIGYVEKNI